MNYAEIVDWGDVVLHRAQAMSEQLGRLPAEVLLATVGYFLWWAFSWFHQYQVMMDVADILRPERLTDKRERLEYV